MAYVPPALRKRAQGSAPDEKPGTAAENLPPGIAPPRPVTEPTFSQPDIHNHYWDPQNEGKGVSAASWSTINASAQEPDRLKYIILFIDANPRWESHGVIFVKSKLHILPGGERFRGEQLHEAGAIPSRDQVTSGWVDGNSTHESENLTGQSGILTNEVSSEKSLVEGSQVGNEPQGFEEQGGKEELPEESGKKRGSTKDKSNSELPYSPDLSLHPTGPIAVFEQAHGGRGSSAAFRFAGYHRIASLEYLPPHSRELFQLLEQKFTLKDRRGRVRQKQRSADSWKSSLNHRWAVIQLEKDQEADGSLPAPEIEVREKSGGDAGASSSGKSVKELLAEMRLKG